MASSHKTAGAFGFGSGTHTYVYICICMHPCRAYLLCRSNTGRAALSIASLRTQKQSKQCSPSLRCTPPPSVPCVSGLRATVDIKPHHYAWLGDGCRRDPRFVQPTGQHACLGHHAEMNGRLAMRLTKQWHKHSKRGQQQKAAWKTATSAHTPTPSPTQSCQVEKACRCCCDRRPSDAPPPQGSTFESAAPSSSPSSCDAGSSATPTHESCPSEGA